MNKIVVLLICGLLLVNCGKSTEKFFGCWQGAINAIQKIPIKICFERNENKISGIIDIPMQNAKGLKLSNISFGDDTCHFDLIVSPQNIAKFSGKMIKTEDGTYKIAGDFFQLGIKGTFELEPYTEPKTETQTYEAYYEEEVEILNGGIKLAGTFTRPKQMGRYPTLIFVTGSGKQDRDEEVFGFKIFKHLSDSLVKYGFATLRTDDRGIGGSTDLIEKTTTTFDVADDILAIQRFLKDRNDVDTNNIGILGHSEGAISALIAVSKNSKFKFAVCMAGPVIRGDSLIIEQLRLMLKNENVPEELAREVISQQNEIFDIVRKNQGWERAKEILMNQAKKQLEQLPEDTRRQISNTLIERNIQLQLESLKSDWFRTFIDLKPIEFLEKTNCPVLFIFAERDQQVPAEINTNQLNNLLKKKKNISVFTVAEANHLFQPCKTGSTSEYGSLPNEFVKDFIPKLRSWLSKVVNN